MMPNCQYILCDRTAEFLGPNELPSACELHLGKLEDRIAQYRERHPRVTDLVDTDPEDDDDDL